MFDQTRMNGQQREAGTREAGTQVSNRASALAYDLITLAELQAKLLLADLREAGAQAAASAIGLGVMAALCLSAMAVGLLGCAELLVETGLHRGAAYLIVAFAGLAVAGAAGWISFQRIRRVSTVFSRTHQELYANLEFVKSLVQSSTGQAAEPDASRATGWKT